jgi:predicted O-methyltransferase YrrM
MSFQRWRQLEVLRSCQTIEDYYQFAQDNFGLGQNRGEITGFIQYALTESPRIVCEIGTRYGGTNFLLGSAIPSVRRVIGIDLLVQNRAKLRFFSRKDQSRFYLNGSSHSAKMVTRLRNILRGQKIDVLFIDGDHTFDGAREDFLSYKGFVSEGGLVVFHDIIPDHYTRYGRDTIYYAGEVHLLWALLEKVYSNISFIDSYDQDGAGIGVIHYYSNISFPSGI